MLVAARIGTMAANGGNEAMYKELFVKNLMGEITEDLDLDFAELGITKLRLYALGFLKSRKVVFRGIEDFSNTGNGNFFYTTQNTIEEFSIPDGVYFDIGSFSVVGSKCSKITIKDFVKKGQFSYIFSSRGLQGCTALRDFFITSRTAQSILSDPDFPFASNSYNANINLVRFHGSDGNSVVHNGTEWVVVPTVQLRMGGV